MTTEDAIKKTGLDEITIVQVSFIFAEALIECLMKLSGNTEVTIRYYKDLKRAFQLVWADYYEEWRTDHYDKRRVTQ